MTLSNKSIKYHLPIVALSLVLNACSSIPQEKVDMIKPDSLSIKESIVAKSAEERNQFVENKLEIEKAKIEQKKRTEKVDNIAGFGVLETNDKTPPIFENTEQVTISVDGMTVVEFIHYVFDELLNLNYVISTQLQSDTNKVSLNLSDPVDKDVLYSTSEQLLAENDIALLRKDNIIYFQKKAKNKRYKTASVGIGRLDGDVPDTTGEIVQIPPVYSAVKVNGIPSYRRVRSGEEVKLKERKITIYDFEIANMDLPFVEFEVRCSKGTYIRTLAHDFGRKLDNGAYLTALRRTKTSGYDVKDAWSLEDLIKAIRDVDRDQ